jgi:hypothetical protein
VTKRNILFDPPVVNDTDLMLDVEGSPIEHSRFGATDAGTRMPPVTQAYCDFLMGDDAVQPMQPGRTP